MDSKGKATNGGMDSEQEEEQNPNNNNNNNISNNELSDEETETNLEQPPPPPLQQEPQHDSRTRTPFTNLSQVDADLALARTLQEQERAYMMLRMNTIEGSDYGSWEAGSYLHDEDDDFGGDGDDEDDDDDGGESNADDHENHECDDAHVFVDDNNDDDDDEDDDEDEDEDEDAFDVHAHDEVDEDDNHSAEYDSDVFSTDEAYARYLQDAEERDMAARLLALAGINDREIVDPEDHGGHSQDTWEEVDPDELSYEELLALGEVIGSESRGLSADTIATLPTVNYKTGASQNGSNDSCVICRLDYEDDETLTVLSCKHSYHSECINNWLKINKVCPVCSAEVSTSGHS